MRKASLRSRFCCGDANALTNGLASGAMREWIWPMRASHESALSIGLGEMRTLVRSSVFEVSQACIRSTICTSWRSPTEASMARAKARNTRTQRKYWASVDGVKSLSEAKQLQATGMRSLSHAWKSRCQPAPVVNALHPLRVLRNGLGFNSGDVSARSGCFDWSARHVQRWRVCGRLSRCGFCKSGWR